MQQTVSQRVKILREREGLDMAAFANEIGMDSSNYRKWEKGADMNVGFKTITTICKKYKVSADWLLTGEEMPQQPDQQTDCVSTREAIEMIDTTVKRITDSHNAALALIDRMIGTQESVMRNQKLIT